MAYNRFEPGKHPLIGPPIHWVTVAGFKPEDPKAAWLMIRHANGTYEPVRVFDPNLPDPPTLISTRTLEFAPWSDREFYTGGYDGAPTTAATTTRRGSTKARWQPLPSEPSSHPLRTAPDNPQQIEGTPGQRRHA